MKTSTTPIWNCLSTKITYMEIWKAWLPGHISYSASSMPFWNSEMALSPCSLSLNSAEPILHLRACLGSHCLPQEATHSPTHPYTPTSQSSQLLSGTSITHLFLGWWCIPRSQQARSPQWCRSASRTCICSQAPSHVGSTWWCQGCWCLPSVAAPRPPCRWLDVKITRD